MKLVLLLIGALIAPTLVCAQTHPPAEKGFGVGNITTETKATIATTEYYTGLRLAVEKPDFPVEKKKKDAVIAALLDVFGGRVKDTRSITVTIKLKSGGVDLGEYSLITYSIDKKAHSVSSEVNTGLIFPMKRLGSNEYIEYKVVYRDAQRREYNFTDASKGVADLIPGSAVINFVTKPFFQKVSTAASGLLGGIQSYENKSAYSDTLAPYSDLVKQAVIPLGGKDGTSFGKITLTLVSTPTLLRTAETVLSLKASDLAFTDLEDPATLSYEIGGVTKMFMAELRALPAFGKLNATRSDANIADYCTDARNTLSANFDLGLMDRAALIYASLQVLGYSDVTTKTGWFHACFNPAEKASLTVSKKVTPPQPTPDPDIRAQVLSKPLLYAFGCQIRMVTGNDCQTNAKDPASILDANIADQVEIIIDSAFIPAVSLGNGNSIARGTLISLLKGTAEKFERCQDSSMLVSRGTKPDMFLLEGEIQQKKVTKLRIRPVEDKSAVCAAF
jgi:hypothetical protein